MHPIVIHPKRIKIDIMVINKISVSVLVPIKPLIITVIISFPEVSGSNALAADSNGFQVVDKRVAL